MINKILYLLIKLSEKKIIFLTDKFFIKMKYYYVFHKKLNLQNPQSFNEKLQWIKLYDRNIIYSTLVDKYEVKKYLKDKIDNSMIIPTLGIYDCWKQIDFSKLPNSFVIKCTHNSGGVVIVNDKEKLDYKNAKRIIEKSLKSNFYYYAREWPYKNVKPRIIIEKLLNNNGKEINDYKFQMFNGELGYSFVCTNREKNDVKYTFFDKNKNFIEVTQCSKKYDKYNAKLPEKYDIMLNIAKKLSKNIPEIRIDFYEINNKVYFGEFTFFDSGGFGIFEPDEWDFKFGSMLNLNINSKK